MSTKTLVPTRKRSWLWPAVAALAVIAAAIWMAVQPTGNGGPEAAVRLAIPEPEDIEFTDLFSISPDGRSVAFIGNSEGGSYVMVRDFDTDTFRRFDETRATNELELNGAPIWSPDGRSVAYWASIDTALGELRRLNIESRQTQRIAAVPGALNGGFWSPDDDIVYTYGGSNGVWRVSSVGGTPVRLTQGPHTFPSPLSGTRFLYRDFDTGAAYAAALDAAPEDQDPVVIMEDVDVVGYVANPDVNDAGYLVILEGGALSATPFDPDRLERGPNAEVLATNVSRNARINQGTSGVFSPPGFSVSGHGLIYRTAESSLMQLTWFDAAGNPVRRYEEVSEYEHMRLSPDGDRLAAVRLLEPGTGEYDIWIHELNGPVERSTPLTSEAGPEVDPIWSPDGRRIAYQSWRGPESGFDLYVENSDGTGTPQLLYAGDADNQPSGPSSWSSDGEFILFSVMGNPPVIWLLSLETNDARPYIADGNFAELSPDDRWVAYNSRKTGQFEIYVQAFDPSPDAQRPAFQVSVGGGYMAHWAEDGRRLFYTTDPERVMMVVDVEEGPDGNPRVGEPERLFDAEPASEFWWDVSPAGDRFIMPVSNLAADAAAFRVVLDWTALMNGE